MSANFSQHVIATLRGKTDFDTPAPNPSEVRAAAELEAQHAARYRWILDNLGPRGRVDVYVLGPDTPDWGEAPQIKSAGQLDAAIADAMRGPSNGR